MKIAALQLSTLKTQKELESYLQACIAQKVKVVLLGEYLLSPFFKRIESLQKNQIQAQAKMQQEELLRLSCGYNLIIVAPIIESAGKKIYKSIMILNKGKAIFYRAQKLMPYEHWNEAQYFDNAQSKIIKIPPIFSVGGFKFSTLFGYELHFDEFWVKLKNSGVDCVLLPSASTFDSSLRWRSLIKMRAFLNGCYILRANRIGEYEDTIANCTWNFYGDSLLVNPNGEISDCLGDREELLIGEINKKELQDIRNCWKF